MDKWLFFLLFLKARELINGIPGNDELTSTTTLASVTIRDVNDSPPTFTPNNVFVSLSENTPPGTPLAVEMNVHDPDVVCFIFFCCCCCLSFDSC